MKIINISIINPKINIEKTTLDFTKKGIYIISGENGAGKTTLMRSLVFENNKVSFEKSHEELLYNVARHELFSYVPQEIPVYSISVHDYLFKGRAFDKTDAEKMMEQLLMTNVSLSDDFGKLSGGEQLKLAIIAALLKKTPYIFLDEPSNHLDNSSVVALRNQLIKIGYSATIILISHDSRLTDMSINAIYEIGTDGHVVKSYNSIVEKSHIEYEHETNINWEKDINYKLFSLKTTFNMSTLCALLLFCVACAILVFTNTNIYKSGYSHSNGSYPEDTIMLYKAEYSYTGLNSWCGKFFDLSINEQNYNNFVTYDDIDDIAAIDNVTNVIVYNEEALISSLVNVCSGSADKASVTIYSVPDIFLTDYYNAVSLDINMYGELVSGSYPADGKAQICIPMNAVKDFFKESFSPEILGQEIILDDKTYTLVGVIDNDYLIFLVSFEMENKCIGFYSYQESTYDSFLESLDAGVAETSGPPNVLLYTEEGAEAEVLQQLLQRYPCENYISTAFTNAFEIEYNKSFVLSQVLFINLFVSFCISIIILIIRRRQLKIDQRMIVDYSLYYVTKNKFWKRYLLNTSFQFIFFIGYSLFLNIIMDEFAYVNNMFIFVDTCIIFAPSLIFLRSIHSRDINSVSS